MSTPISVTPVEKKETEEERTMRISAVVEELFAKVVTITKQKTKTKTKKNLRTKMIKKDKKELRVFVKINFTVMFQFVYAF